MSNPGNSPQIQETFGSLLGRLANVIADTQEQAAVAGKIHAGTAEASQRLGFTFLTAPALGSTVSNPEKGPADFSPTALQWLDALITQLGDANCFLGRTNENNDNLRSALSNQL